MIGRNACPTFGEMTFTQINAHSTEISESFLLSGHVLSIRFQDTYFAKRKAWFTQINLCESKTIFFSNSQFPSFCPYKNWIEKPKWIARCSSSNNKYQCKKVKPTQNRAKKKEKFAKMMSDQKRIFGMNISAQHTIITASLAIQRPKTK